MIKKVIIFLSGLLVGAGASFFVTKKIMTDKHDAEMRDMIDKINAERSAMKAELTSNKPDISTFKKIEEEKPAEVSVHSVFDNASVEEKQPEVKKKAPAKSSKKKKPTVYEITEDEFNDVDNREKVLLSYYSDKVLANTYNDKQVDISSTIGYDMLDMLGDEKLDSLHVRNESNNTDYEITRDFREFSEIVERYIDEDAEY